MIASTALRIAVTDAAPIVARERLAHVDVLRGFALSGILLVNVERLVARSFPVRTSGMAFAHPDLRPRPADAPAH